MSYHQSPKEFTEHEIQAIKALCEAKAPWYSTDKFMNAAPTPRVKEERMPVDNEPSAAVRVMKDATFWTGTCFAIAIISIGTVVCFGIHGCTQHEGNALRLKETELLYKAVAQPVQDDLLRNKIRKAMEDDDNARKGKP